MSNIPVTATVQPVVSETTALVPVFMDAIGGIQQHVCDARTLHAFLEVSRDFPSWFADLVDKYEFVAGQDFAEYSPDRGNKPRGRGKPRIDYILPLDTAKEVSMVQNNARGREARRYFIAMERQALAQQAPALPALITPLQAGELATLIAERFPDGGHRAYAWSRFNNHFRIARYRELPASRFDEAREYVGTIPLRALPPAKAEPITPDLLGVIEMAAVRIQRCFPRSDKLRARVMRRLGAEVGVERMADVTLDQLPKLFACLSRLERQAEHYQMLANNAEMAAIMHLIWRTPEDDQDPPPGWVAMIA